MTKAAQPTTAAEIVALIRAANDGPVHGFWAVTPGEAIDLIEQYAAVVAGEAAIRATRESFDKCIAVYDDAMSRPLASPSSAEGRE